jgi:hypothetical protein
MLEVSIGKSNDEMDSQYEKEIKAISNDKDLQVFAENWGMDVEEVIADPMFPLTQTEETQDRGLVGNRDKDGSFMTAGTDDDAYAEVVAEADTITMYDSAGNSQTVLDIPGMVDLMEKNGWNVEPDEDEVDVEEPHEELDAVLEERPGWQKNPGANWWNVNTKSAYWKTADGQEEAKSIYGELPSWAK